MHGTIDIERIIGEADSEYPALYQLFGGYLNQDWRTEYRTPDEALDAFKQEAPIAAVHDALVELDRLEELHLDDATMSRLLSEGFECGYQPPLDGVDTVEWIRRLRTRLLPERPTSH
jgi:CdiI immunity protein